MNENEEKAFRMAIAFYGKWRGTILETEEQWQQFAEDVGRFAREADIDHNPLGMHLLVAMTDTFNDLYRNGMKPLPANYFGREDLG